MDQPITHLSSSLQALSTSIGITAARWNLVEYLHKDGGIVRVIVPVTPPDELPGRPFEQVRYDVASMFVTPVADEDGVLTAQERVYERQADGSFLRYTVDDVRLRQQQAWYAEIRERDSGDDASETDVPDRGERDRPLAGGDEFAGIVEGFLEDEGPASLFSFTEASPAALERAVDGQKPYGTVLRVLSTGAGSLGEVQIVEYAGRATPLAVLVLPHALENGDPGRPMASMRETFAVPLFDTYGLDTPIFDLAADGTVTSWQINVAQLLGDHQALRDRLAETRLDDRMLDNALANLVLEVERRERSVPEHGYRVERVEAKDLAAQLQAPQPVRPTVQRQRRDRPGQDIG